MTKKYCNYKYSLYLTYVVYFLVLLNIYILILILCTKLQTLVLFLYQVEFRFHFHMTICLRIFNVRVVEVNLHFYLLISDNRMAEDKEQILNRRIAAIRQKNEETMRKHKVLSHAQC